MDAPASVRIESGRNCTKLNLISGSAFYDCRSLTSIVLPEGLQTINGRAFGPLHVS